MLIVRVFKFEIAHGWWHWLLGGKIVIRLGGGVWYGGIAIYGASVEILTIVGMRILVPLEMLVHRFEGVLRRHG